jgi:cytochrome b6-f complex iron-sulfur subunit
MTAAGTPAPTTPPITRREFLYYIWGASMALFMAELGGAMVWFALPRFKAGEFGGVFVLDIGKIPQVDADPQDNPAGRFWLVNVGPKRTADPRQPQDYPAQPGLVAIYKVCVHLGCLYKWVPVNDRFECPCHGSKYLATGARVGGPARRNLDVFIMTIKDAGGNVLVKTKTGDPYSDATAGAPLPIPANAATIEIDTGKRIQGGANTQPNGGK